MSKLDTDKVHKIPMPIVKDYMVITSRFITKNECEIVTMVPITEKEEKALDEELLNYVRDNINVVIDSKCKPIYGKIDFHTGSDDYYILETMDWLNHLTFSGIVMPSNYNYEEHCAYSPNKSVMFYDTTNPAIVAQYKHACMGKPERVCIFKRKVYAHNKS